MNKCETCRFYAGDYGSEFGPCLRHAPSPLVVRPGEATHMEQFYGPPHKAGRFSVGDAVWPWVRPGAWCGDYKRAIAALRAAGERP